MIDVIKPPFTMQDVEVVEQETPFSGFFRVDRLRLRHRLYAGPWSEVFERELFIRDDAVCVLLYDPQQDAVVMVEQFRIGALSLGAEPENSSPQASPWLLELVAGIIEPEETPAAVAHREAHEEAGAEILALEPIHHYHVSPGGSQERVHLFCGRVDSTGIEGYHGLAEEHEDIRVVKLSRADAYAAMKQQRISNAASIIAIQWLQLNWTELQEKWLHC